MEEEENNNNNNKEGEDKQNEEIDSSSLVFECILDKKWTGALVHISDNKVEVKFKATEEMAIDENGLIHSSFIMSACEYTALAVVNKENMYMQSVEAEYLAPIEIDTVYIIKATTKYQGDKKKIITVQAFCKEIKIFDGTFYILELEQHILDIKLNEQMG
jgi:acyl-coenzyme A thioesterase PaaI-like protein